MVKAENKNNKRKVVKLNYIILFNFNFVPHSTCTLQLVCIVVADQVIKPQPLMALSVLNRHWRPDDCQFLALNYMYISN